MKEVLEDLNDRDINFRKNLSMIIEASKRAKLQAKLMKNRPLDYFANEIITIAERELEK